MAKGARGLFHEDDPAKVLQAKIDRLESELSESREQVERYKKLYEDLSDAYQSLAFQVVQNELHEEKT